MWKVAKCIVVMLCCHLLVAASSWAVEVGEPIPYFGLQSLPGATTSHGDTPGKPMLLVFWNTWCPNCLRELPRVSKLAEKYPAELTVVAVNTGLNDSEEKTRAYWKKFAYQFPTAFDRRFELTQSFRIVGVPSLFLVDSAGIVRYKGSTLPSDIDERVRQLARK